MLQKHGNQVLYRTLHNIPKYLLLKLGTVEPSLGFLGGSSSHQWFGFSFSHVCQHTEGFPGHYLQEFAYSAPSI